MRKSKYTESILQQAVDDNLSLAGVFRSLGLKPTGGNYTYIKQKIDGYGISISHFTGAAWNTGLKFRPMKTFSMEDILVENSSYQSSKLRLRLINEGYKEYVCEKCLLTEWMGFPIPLELHHLNGIHDDNRLENLQILCSNCHSLTENFGNKNKA